MYELLCRMQIPTGKCYGKKEDFYRALQNGEASYPVFVKPVKGSASMDIQTPVAFPFQVTDYLPRYIYAAFMGVGIDGTEYGADVYIDMLTGKCTSIFIKEKVKMRAGETDKSVSVKDEKLFAIIEKFVEKCGFYGMIDIDIFQVKDTYYISEVNPRFGGGYPHAHEFFRIHPTAVNRRMDNLAAFRLQFLYLDVIRQARIWLRLRDWVGLLTGKDSFYE